MSNTERLKLTSKPSVLDQIEALKQQHDAVILAHYYEDSDIQDIADYVGDSFYLAKIGQQLENPVLLLAGVVFMAESVKLLSPEKTVLVPDLAAGCSLVEHSPYEKYKAWRQQHPEAIAVSYINCSAEVKSLSDIICTSSNAEQVIDSIPEEREILFGPDRNLGAYLSKKLNRPMHLWPGACEVHVLFSARRLFELKSDNPEAPVLAHPECNEAVLEQADVIGSTSRLLNEVKENPSTTFIVATESGIFHQMQKLRPEVQLLQAPAEGSCACNECPYMKLNNLDKIAQALSSLEPQVRLPAKIIPRARQPLDRMLQVSRGETITWPMKYTDH